VRVVKGRAGAPSILEIRVAGPAAAIVQHQAPDILSRVGMMLGDPTVSKLRIVQGPVKPAPGAKQQARKRPKGPLDAATEAQLAEGLSEAPDGPLKAALLRLGREVLRDR
jgi:hypothetical protein